MSVSHFSALFSRQSNKALVRDGEPRSILRFNLSLAQPSDYMAKADLRQMDPVTSIVELTKQGIALVTEQKLRRQRFFNEIIRPIHERFKEMRKNHMETFVHVRSVISQPYYDPKELIDYVTSRTRDEAHNWYLFDGLCTLGEKSRVRLGPQFATYCEVLESCIRDVSATRMTVGFYLNLLQRLEHIAQAAARYDARTPKSNRIAEIDELIDAFNEYCSKVEKAYLDVCSECMI
ncbi:MAG TPA: hypothetical protein VHC44_17300 [Verrucomicrobiae bacterium]|nr:hypothetical protein [Verrucomicrobiae bacterium]